MHALIRKARMTSVLAVATVAVGVDGCSDEPVSVTNDAIGPEIAPQLVHEALQRTTQESRSRRDTPWWTMSDNDLQDSVAAAGGRVLIGFKEVDALAGVDEYGRVLAGTHVRAEGRELLEANGALDIRPFRLMPGAEATIDPAVVGVLRRHPLVDYIEPVTEGTWLTQTTPWNISRVKAPQAWSEGTGSGVKLLIVDSGIDDEHDDLDPYVIQACDQSNGVDQYGHGTHVSGIAAALDNSIDVVGVAYDVEVWSSKVGTLAPSTGAVQCAVEFARTNDLFVLSMSFSVTPSTALTDEINGAYDDGIVLVAAAGNSGTGTMSYPAGLDAVIAVGATDDDDVRWTYSNYGSGLELVAPGVDVLSTCMGGGTCENTGTSMAAPHVAAAAALLKSVHSSWTNQYIRGRLAASAQDLGTSGWDQYYGWGLLDVDAALNDGDPPEVHISGPTRIKPGATCTWHAVVTDGDPTFTYYWSGQIDPYTGSEAYYTGKKDSGQQGSLFTIRVDVSNAVGSDNDVITVQEDPNAMTCFQ